MNRKHFLFLLLALLLLLPPVQAVDSVELFTGPWDDSADSLPAAGTFDPKTALIIAFNDDSADTIYLKLTGTGATTADIPIKAGDPPLYFPFSTSRASVICAAGQSCDGRIIVVKRLQ